MMRFAVCVRHGSAERAGCDSVRPSDARLPFFFDRGPESAYAAACRCGYTLSAHTPETLAKAHMQHMRDVCGGTFERRGAAPNDTFDCGCGGWS